MNTLTYESCPGELIDNVAKEMITLANKTGNIVTTKFNDVLITVDINSIIKDIVTKYRRQCKKNIIIYQKTLEEKYNQVIKELPLLDFNNNVEILKWLCELQDSHSYLLTGSKEKSSKILHIFSEHDYYPDIEVSVPFEKEGVARWIIGRALGDLKDIGIIQPVIHEYVNNWYKKL